ncbi:hypothetical protein LTS08_005587 [Lithohypha guttulata]|uniref:Bet v1-like protein n=1 Tax=Lithohypha guttulata TaxID=1690604 RepID=A0AAN7T1Z1_9EURO|nr:hypothetical protein LTR51_003243 [Lithohypha guttulata]KAK5087063.1 hypothetical protein LTR05_004234 [Lithohypha guttulata]KAK5099872.1 hypothetical protein LTS08_005587 [Lithohypha guttulata]
MSAIPTSTSVSESAVIPAHFSDVWHLIKLQDFSKWWSALSKSETLEGSTSPETDVVRWTFTDGTSFDIKQEEHSTINHFITYSVVSASTDISYTSVLSTIRLHEITTGSNEGQTFVVWTANFSNDAGADVIQDARYKRKEALADLAKASSKK